MEQQKRAGVRRRYMRRVEEPQSGWWPWGWLPLLGLLGVFLFGALRTAPHIQAQTDAAVASTLDAAGYGVINVIANGQGVAVTAIGPASAESAIRAIAGQAECDTWIGRLVCPIDVALKLRGEPVASQPIPAAATAEPGLAPASTARFHNFELAVNGGAAVLSGEVPNTEAKSALGRLASFHFDGLTNDLAVSNDAAHAGQDAALQLGADVLRGLERGRASWRNGVLSIRGVVSPDREAAAREQLAAAGDRVPLGAIELQLTKSAGVCDEEFAVALERSTIRFDTGSAAIHSDSNRLLRSLAELAKQCPGDLLIEGHTDDVGSEAFNFALSLRRAHSVRTALADLDVPQARLTAKGFGPSVPIADNGTASGRAKNRRIVIRVDGA